MKFIYVVPALILLCQSCCLFTHASDSLAEAVVEAAENNGDTECDDSSEENNGTLCETEADEGVEPEALPLANARGVMVDDPTEISAGMSVFGDPLLPLHGPVGRVYDLKMGTADIHGTSHPNPYDPVVGVLNGMDDGLGERNILPGIIGLRGSNLPHAPPGGLLGDAQPPPRLYETVGADVPIVVLKNDPTYKRIREETKHHKVISLEPLVSLLDDTTGSPNNALQNGPTQTAYNIIDSNPNANPDTTNRGVKTDIGAKSDTSQSPVSAALKEGNLAAVAGANSVTTIDIFSLVPDPARPGHASLLNIIKREIKRRNS